MNRTDKRNQKRVQDKLMKWVQGWTPQQKQLFDQMVLNEVDKVNEITEKIVNDCYGIAMQEYVEALTVEQVNDILKNANDFMEDVRDFMYKEGNDYMKKITDEGFREEVVVAAKEILKSNDKLSTFEVAEQLEKEYKVAKKDLHIFVVEARREMKAETKEDSLTKEEISKIKDSGTITVEQVAKLSKAEVFTPIFKNPNKKTLKIKSIDIEGVYGCYRYYKGTEEVKVGDKTFKNILEVQAERDFRHAEIKAKREELLSEIKKINEKMHNLDHEDKENSEKYAEIEEVFSI